MQRDYYSLHAHSEFSNIKVIDSINRYSRSIDYAWQLNLAGVAMTEHDCVSGAIKYLDAFDKKLKTEWKNAYPEQEYPGLAEAAKALHFKPILGNEIYLTPEGMNKDNADRTAFYHLILLAKDKEGFKQIRQLSSAAWGRSWMKGILRTPTYPSDLEKYIKGGHLVCSTACLGGYLASTVNRILAGEGDLKVVLDSWLNRMEKLFGKGNFFIELQPNKGDVNTDQIIFNKYVLANYWGKYPFIITTDAHYLNAEERELHKWFLNSKSSSDREVDEFYRYAYFMNKDEIASMMDYATAEQLEEMFENTLRIADTIQVYTLEAPKVLAKVEYEHAAEYEEDLDIFNDVDEEAYPVFAEYLKSKDATAHYLMELIAHGYIEKYNDKWKTQEYYARLEEELWTIKEVGAKINQPMEDYFITMSKMIELMWNEGNSIVGPSRGSAGTMLINYLLGITQMDPIQMDLPYVWRFLHPSRPDLPDVDVDTESDKRSQVFNAVRNYFKGLGGDLIHICTFGTEGTKSAINTAGRGLNIDPDEISYITSMVKNERGFDWSLHDCYYGNGDDRKPVAAFIEEMNKYPELWKLAQCIEGLVTRLGVHASGVVALNSDITDYNSIMRTSAGQIVSAYDLHDSERAGLVKYDFLTVSALDRIRVAMNYLLEDGVWKWQGSLRETYNKYLAPSVINFDSKEMWDDADSGDITSLFQLTSVELN